MVKKHIDPNCYGCKMLLKVIKHKSKQIDMLMKGLMKNVTKKN